MKKRLICILLVAVMTMSMIATTAFAAESPEQNKKEIYTYLTGTMGLNTAAACGIMSNIYHETGFRVDIYDASGGYYGMFMYYSGLSSQLFSWCDENGYDHRTINGQLTFFNYLMKKSYSSLLTKLQNVSNTADGAYSAADMFCREFERPANASAQGVRRGTYASGTLFPEYASGKVDTSVNTGNTGSTGSTGNSVTAVSYTAYVTATTLNVRGGAGVGYSIQDVLECGDAVSVVGESGNWAKLSSGGWVSRNYLSKTAPSGSSNGSTTYTVNASGGLNVRSGAGTEYSVVKTISNGASVTIVSKSGNWGQLSSGGWVSMDYLTTGSGSSSSSTNTSGAAYTVNASGGLNVRSGAGTGNDVVNYLSNGTAVTVVSTSKDASGTTWAKLSIGGWVSMNYLTTGNSGSTSSTGNTYTVEASGGLNVRSGAGTGCNVVNMLSNGASVTVVSTTKDASGTTWGKLSSGGWVSMEYLK